MLQTRTRWQAGDGAKSRCRACCALRDLCPFQNRGAASRTRRLSKNLLVVAVVTLTSSLSAGCSDRAFMREISMELSILPGRTFDLLLEDRIKATQ
jgi:hypothetical protein